ncbi:DEKNAAC100416 [Brettanomyces naardenensis]|uniref:DEKNAAC100417 n=1 Tax=Brettanomyces naardenensis TaxID=13370 RepID=A0A448YEP2_BRENA|nr:DEKNAAC100416 [Brettanomyces naardenensis]
MPSLQLHEKFHRRAMEGIEIGGQLQVMKFGRTVQEFEMSSNLHAKVVEADPRNRRAVQIIRESLELVNKELNAPKDNESWSIDGGLKGKVFVCICKSRIVGVCSTDKPSRGYWMVYETGSLVPRQTLKLQIGISRIYVSHKFRRHGIGLKLLQAVAKNSYYGLTLKGHQIGWSQPSQFGGLLAKRFNGVKHPGSGKILIPVYKEEEC